MTKYRIEILCDDCYENPLNEQKHVVFACSHRRYKLGNMDLDELLRDYGYKGDWCDMNQIQTHMKKFGYVEVLSMTDHSGLTFHRGARSGWDTGIIGIIFIPQEKYSRPYKWIWNDVIDAYLEDYEHYINGDIYEYSTYEYTSNGLEYIDGCTGYFSYDACKNEAISQLEDDAEIELVWIG